MKENVHLMTNLALVKGYVSYFLMVAKVTMIATTNHKCCRENKGEQKLIVTGKAVDNSRFDWQLL